MIVIFSFVTEPCCALKYYPEIEICVKEQKGEQEAKRKEAQRLEDENFGNHIIGRVRTFLWNLFEYPETSKAAQVCYYYYYYIQSNLVHKVTALVEFQAQIRGIHTEFFNPKKYFPI